MRLKGKTALISGAGRNTGKAIALTFAREGADLILVARTGDEVKQVAKECEGFGVQALPLPADVGKHEEVNSVVQLGLERFGKVDVLVSVAAIRPQKPFWEFSYDEWHQVFAVNVHSTFYLAKVLVPAMMKRGKGGSIIALGGSLNTAPCGAAKVASKDGLYGLVKSLAMDLWPYGIRANLLGVGAIGTERRNPEWYPPSHPNPHGKPGQHDRTPLRRVGTTQEVANVALFLASDESSNVTGDRIYCGGGRYI